MPDVPDVAGRDLTSKFDRSTTQDELDALRRVQSSARNYIIALNNPALKEEDPELPYLIEELTDAVVKADAL